MKNLWTNLPEPAPDEQQAGVSLWNEYLSHGCIHRTVTEMLRLPDGAITYFYRKLADVRPLESPVSRFSDSGWMAEADICFVNIRATGLGDQPGNFLHAAKMLPALRVSAIHLGPFTDYDFDTIYAVRSVRSISPHVVDSRSSISAADQLRAFVQAAHLLGKAVGFDLEPHVAQFAAPVVTRPELFRWFKLSADKRCLADGLSDDEMLAEDHQQRITREIREIVSSILEGETVGDLEMAAEDSSDAFAKKQQALFHSIAALIDRGYWPIPSQSWAGVGVPAYGGYNFDGNYARFDYRDRRGGDQSASAFHILTPYKYYAGLRTNRPSGTASPYQPAIDYFCNIFPYWRDHFGFDFVRYDSADHIFDSLVDEVQPASDRPTPRVLQSCIENSKAPDQPYVGNFAERMGNEIEQYAAVGFDLILGDDMLQSVNAALLEKSFELYDRLETLNRSTQHRAGIAFCVDTHDTGNPALWGEPLVKVVGPAQMGMRHFLSRFLDVGDAPRPKYEVMGSQDLSYGLYRSNVSTTNLTWIGDTAYNRRYHHLEDIFERYRPLLRQGRVTQRHVEPSYAWWLITSGADWLMPFIAFTETGSVAVDLPLPGDSFILTRHDFNQTDESVTALSTPRLDIPALAPGTCLLFAIHPASRT